MGIIVRKYSLQAPINWNADCREHLWLENKFWNMLVEIEHGYRKAWDQMFLTDPDYAVLHAEYERIEAEITQAWDARRAERAKSRKKATENDDGFQATIDALVAQRKQSSIARTARRNQLRKLPEYVDTAKSLEDARKESVKKARQTIASEGLWWGNYNAVIDSYSVARIRAIKDHVQLRFHPFDGTGRFSMQIQGGVTAGDIMSGKSNVVSVEPIAPETFLHVFGREKTTNDFQWLNITVYTTKEDKKTVRRTLTFPIYLSREIPKDAIVTMVTVKCQKQDSIPYYAPKGDLKYGLIRRTTQPTIADRFKWTVTFTCKTTDEAPSSASPSACGLNMGWRSTPKGIRIATLVGSDGAVEHFYLPDSVLRGMDRRDRLKAELDADANGIRDHIENWVAQAADEAPTDEAAEAVRQAWMESAKQAVASRSHEKLYRLALLWADWDYHREWFEQLEAWRSVKKPRSDDPDYDARFHAFWNCDKRKRQEMDGVYARAQNQRLDHYKLIAQKIAKQYAVIGLGQLDLQNAARKVVNDKDENDMSDHARGVRQKACLSELTEWIAKQAAKHGSAVVKAKRPVTITCHNCGDSKQKIAAMDIAHVCAKCHTSYDRDVNAATVALQDAMMASEVEEAA